MNETSEGQDLSLWPAVASFKKAALRFGVVSVTCKTVRFGTQVDQFEEEAELFKMPGKLPIPAYDPTKPESFLHRCQMIFSRPHDPKTTEVAKWDPNCFSGTWTITLEAGQIWVLE